MICRSCRTSMLSRLSQRQTVTWTASSAARQLPLARNQFRLYSDKSTTNPSVAAPPPPPSPRQPSGDSTTLSAVSSATPGISQPFSTPEGVHIDAKPAALSSSTGRPPSSCPAGTKLTGLNYFKNKPDVFAKDDSEYPGWLWDLLEDSTKQEKRVGGVDPSSMWTLK